LYNYFCDCLGAFFANVILGEELTVYGIGGAALITIAAATNAFLDLTDKSNEIN
jgi:drug/metabolite transporter (DMT)-like permease